MCPRSRRSPLRRCRHTDAELPAAAPPQAPDGNGGIYDALRVSGTLDALEAQGIRSVHVFSVDNAICKVCDPLFIGYCLGQGAAVGNTVVWKANAGEKVGVVAKRNGRPAIIEYSELGEEVCDQW